jgi:hypothetical protein
MNDWLKYGTVFDWISPALAIAQDVAAGSSHTFVIPQECGWTGREIISLLNRNGVQSWGHMIVSGMIMITVRQTQADWAQYLLDRAGIPVEAGPVDDRDVRTESSQSGATNSRRSGGLTGLLRDLGLI